MIPERFGRAINQYFLGLGAWLMVILTAWPQEVVSQVGEWVKEPPSSGSLIGILFLVTGPVISLGAAVDSLARLSGLLLVKVSGYARKFYRFTHSSYGTEDGGRRKHSAVVYAKADAHIFEWVTGHLIRGKFAASWAIMWGLALLPTWRLVSNGVASKGTAVGLALLECSVAVLLFVWSLHQLSVYEHYLAPDESLERKRGAGTSDRQQKADATENEREAPNPDDRADG